MRAYCCEQWQSQTFVAAYPALYRDSTISSFSDCMPVPMYLLALSPLLPDVFFYSIFMCNTRYFLYQKGKSNTSKFCLFPRPWRVPFCSYEIKKKGVVFKLKQRAILPLLLRTLRFLLRFWFSQNLNHAKCIALEIANRFSSGEFACWTKFLRIYYV